MSFPQMRHCNIAMYVCMYVGMYVCMHTCMYQSMQVCMRVNVCVFFAQVHPSVRSSYPRNHVPVSLTYQLPFLFSSAAVDGQQRRTRRDQCLAQGYSAIEVFINSY
jgi:hypothetical protein